MNEELPLLVVDAEVDFDELAAELIDEITNVEEGQFMLACEPEEVDANKAIHDIAIGLGVTMNDARKFVRNDANLFRMFERIRDNYREQRRLEAQEDDKRFKGFSEDEIRVMEKAFREASFRSGYLFEDGALEDLRKELKEARDQ